MQDLQALRGSNSSPRLALREPFLSPSSRRASSVWAPPTPALYSLHAQQMQQQGQGAMLVGANGEVVPTLENNAVAGYGGGNGSGMFVLPGKKELMASSALQRKISCELLFSLYSIRSCNLRGHNR